MRETANFKMFSYFSLFFALLNLVFQLTCGVHYNGIAYIWIIAVNIAVGYLNGRRNQYAVCTLLLALPLALVHGIPDIIFFGVTILLSLFFIFKEIGVTTYSSELGKFKRGFFIMVVLLGVTFASKNYYKIGDLMVLFVTIHLLSSTILLRTLRVVESTDNLALIRKLNIRYSIILLATSFILSIDAVKNVCFQICGFLYSGFASIFIFLLQIPFWILYWVVNLFFKIMSFFTQTRDSIDKTYEKNNFATSNSLKKFVIKNPLSEVSGSTLLNTLLWVGLILGVLLIVFLVYKRNAKTKQDYLSFSEEKEFIFKEKDSQRSLKKMLAQLIKPKTNNELVRFHYIKYLRMCIENKIEILKSDSSEDVNKKACEVFDGNNLKEMRKIYIKARYDKQQLDDESCSVFIENYSRIKKHDISNKRE